MTETSTRAVTYTRISKDQAGDAHGIANQQAALDKHAAGRGWTIVRRLSDNDLSASNGKHRPGFEEVMRLVDAGQADVVLCWAVDRFVRRITDLEAVIGRFTKAGCTLAAVSGDMDLSGDAGRMVARLLSVMAQGEVERKGARQKLAAQQAAAAGKRWTGCPRPFGYAADHVTPDPREAAAIRWAADALLGGSTVSSVMREWNSRGLSAVQGGTPLTRQSVTTVLRNPKIAGIATYRGEIVYGDDGEPVPGDWQPVLPRATWEAVCALLGDPARKRPRGVRTLLGGLARCQCGNIIQGSQSSRGKPVYRCNPVSREGRPGPHATVRAAPVTDYVERVIIARMSRADAASLVTPPATADTAALRTEAASIRRKLDADAVAELRGELTASQLRARTRWGTNRLAEIDADVAAAAPASVLAPFADRRMSARAVWDSLDLARQRAVIGALTPVVICPAGRGARVFDSATVVMTGIPADH